MIITDDMIERAAAAIAKGAPDILTTTPLAMAALQPPRTKDASKHRRSR